MIVGLVMSTLLNCTGGSDPQTMAAVKKIRELIGQEAAQYQDCTTADDCTFFPRIGGFLLNKRGLSLVSNCASDLEQAIFPQCFADGSPHIGEFGMKPAADSIPISAVCENNKCTPISGTKRNWAKENRAAFKKFRTPRIDELCQGFLNSIRKDSASKK